jgi:hypothetical protein
MRRTAGDALSQQHQGRETAAIATRRALERMHAFFLLGSVGASPEAVTSAANRSASQCMRAMHPRQERRSDHDDFSAALLGECCACPAITCLYSIIK